MGRDGIIFSVEVKMKLRKTEWQTDDDCWGCGHRGMIHHFNFFDNNGDMFGSLRCPVC
jgi:hypothetical protein